MLLGQAFTGQAELCQDAAAYRNNFKEHPHLHLKPEQP
ncbi:hypothetical protein E6C60_3948 [Paenibacillus algicola]|uniref:Uncharacterized protein n=1 Tax=Paenibacillus algicola TaxID=2565926 RepID=A0A4P8XQ55_9BACL|nr:hypothetical protein E6C60_3948 [Paenibacillus algicola]